MVSLLAAKVLHGAVYNYFKEWVPEERIGSVMIGFIMGFDLAAYDPIAADRLREAMAEMQDAADFIPDGRGDLDEEVRRLAEVINS